MFRQLISLFLAMLLWTQSIPLARAAVTADQCSNGLRQDQIDKLYTMGVQENKIAQMCSDGALNPGSLDAVLNSGVPDSVIRRLFDNNQASNVINNWPAIMAGIATTGQMPAGVTPYYPEEKDVFKMLGLSDADMQFIPPRDLKEKAEKFAEDEIQRGLDGAVPLATGLAMSYLNLAILAIMSPLLLIPCKSRASVLAYVAVSVIFLIVEVSLWGKYSEAHDRIMALKDGAPKEIQKIQDDGKAAVDDTKAAGTQVAANAQRDCAPLVKAGAPAKDIADCMKKATKIDFSDAEDSWKKVGDDLVNQVKMLEYVRDLLVTIHEIIHAKALNATLTAGVGWTLASTLAALEALEIVTLGACIADAKQPDLKQKVAEFFQLFPEARAMDIGKELEKLGIKSIGPAIGVGIGFLAALVGTIVFAIPGVKASGVARSIFFGIAAGIGYTAGVLLFNGASMIQHYIDQLNTIIKALKKTMSNEGATFDESEWSPPGGYLIREKSETEKWQRVVQRLYSIFSIEELQAAPSGQASCFLGGDFARVVPDPNCQCKSSGSCYAPLNIPVQLPKNVSEGSIRHTLSGLGNIQRAAASAGRGDLQGFEREIMRNKAIKDAVNSENKTLKNFATQIHLQAAHSGKRKQPAPSIPDEAALKKQIESALENKFNSFPPAEREAMLKRLGGNIKLPQVANARLSKDSKRIKNVLDNFEKFRQTLGPYKDRVYPKISSDNEGLDLSYQVSDDDGQTTSSSDDGSDGLNEYDIQMNDIHQDSSADLFQVISQRYLKVVPIPVETN